MSSRPRGTGRIILQEDQKLTLCWVTSQLAQEYALCFSSTGLAPLGMSTKISDKNLVLLIPCLMSMYVAAAAI